MVWNLQYNSEISCRGGDIVGMRTINNSISCVTKHNQVKLFYSETAIDVIHVLNASISTRKHVVGCVGQCIGQCLRMVLLWKRSLVLPIQSLE